jgi:hypothetical protein
MGTTYKGIYLPAVSTEEDWGTFVNNNFTILADREERIVKAAAESVTSSTTLQNDNELLYTMIANHTWAFRLVVLASTAAGSALRSNFTVPASASWTYIAYAPSTATAGRDSTGATSDYVTGAMVSNAEPIIYDGTVTCGATAGNFQYQWAQGASSGTALIVAANSYLLMKLLV